MKTATTIAMIIFIVIAILHVVRLIFQTDVVVGGVVIPMWVSIGGAIVAALLALAIRNEHRA
jgi:hypothetical protein